MQYIKDLLIVKFFDSVVMAVFVAALVLCVSPGVGADNGLTHDFKIGVVNTKEVFDNYERQKKDYEKLREALEEAQKPIAELSEQITRDKERYDAETDSMEEDEQRELEEKIQAAVTRWKAEFDRAQEDIDRQEKKLLRNVLEDIHLAIQEVGAQYNYHLIFEAGPGDASSLAARTGGLLYSSSTLNMTQLVIDYLNDGE